MIVLKGLSEIDMLDWKKGLKYKLLGCDQR